MHIHFVARFLDKLWPDLNRLTDADVDLQANRFQGGVNNWVLQTYLHLRAPLASQGITTSVGERFTPGVMCIAHRDCLNRFFDGSFRSFVVGVRADRPPLYNCDLTIVQNHLGLDGGETVFMPFWPQPGLKPRDSNRGVRIERIAYMGRTGTMPAWYTDTHFLRSLTALGAEFEIRDTQWNDYHDVDLVLACRDESPTILAHKPASKLVNAWLAGTPALLSAEPAFMRLRSDDNDFRVVRGPQDVLTAVAALKNDPNQYSLMIERGQARSKQCNRDRVVASWMHLLTGRARRDYEVWLDARQSEAWRFSVHAARTLRQKLRAKQFRWQVRVDLNGLERA